MQNNLKPATIVFDLDDTLVKEIDYLRSAFREIARTSDPNAATLFDDMFKWYQNKENVFGKLCEKYPHLDLGSLKNVYRNHLPEFDALSENRQLLVDLKTEGHHLGLITDGFSVTQRNKIKALDIGHLFDKIVISEEFGSEKPHENNYKAFDEFGSDKKFYVGDNLSKDFVTANVLGWTTICLLDDGRNIHAQDFGKKTIYLPAHTVGSLAEIRAIIQK